MDEFLIDKVRSAEPRSAAAINQRVRQIERGNERHSLLIGNAPIGYNDGGASESVSIANIIMGGIIGGIKGGIIGGVGGATIGIIIGAILGAIIGGVDRGIIGGDVGGDIGGDGGGGGE